MQTKEYILTNASELFNRQGFTTTSLRQLAAYLDMSDGNLRYHFKDKQVLLTSIYKQMTQELESSGLTGEIVPDRLAEGIRHELRSYFYTMHRYKFLFLESSLLFKQCPGFKKEFGELMEARSAYFMLFIAEHKARGTFKAHFSDDYYQNLAEMVFIIADNWIRYIELEKITPDSIDTKVEHYIDLCMQLLESAMQS